MNLNKLIAKAKISFQRIVCNIQSPMLSIVDHFDPMLTLPFPKILNPGMDPPKELAISDVSEDAVTISWIRPLAPFEYYKLSYQSARGNVYFTYCTVLF